MKKISVFVSWIVFLFLIGGLTMARGTPDDGQNLSSSPTTLITDLGEHAIRLLGGGGANSHSGRWIWVTGFENGTGEFEVNGTVAPVISTTTVYQGAGALKMLAPAVIGQQSYFVKNLFSPFAPDAANIKYGVETMVSFAIANTPMRFYWTVRTPSITPVAGNIMSFQVYLDILGNSNGKLYVNGIQFADVSPHLLDNAGLFHYSKLVIDAKTQKYSSFTFDDQTYNLNAYAGIYVALTNPQIYIELKHEARSAVTATYVWIDNVIVTGDEP